MDYYQILEVSRSATGEDIRKAYRRLAIKWHPDKNRHITKRAEYKFKLISEAYQVLSDERRRRDYDAFLGESCNISGGVESQDSFDISFEDAHEIFKNFFKASNLFTDLDSSGIKSKGSSSTRHHQQPHRNDSKDKTFKTCQPDVLAISEDSSIQTDSQVPTPTESQSIMYTETAPSESVCLPASRENKLDYQEPKLNGQKPHVDEDINSKKSSEQATKRYKFMPEGWTFPNSQLIWGKGKESNKRKEELKNEYSTDRILSSKQSSLNPEDALTSGVANDSKKYVGLQKKSRKGKHKLKKKAGRKFVSSSLSTNRPSPESDKAAANEKCTSKQTETFDGSFDLKSDKPPVRRKSVDKSARSIGSIIMEKLSPWRSKVQRRQSISANFPTPHTPSSKKSDEKLDLPTKEPGFEIPQFSSKKYKKRISKSDILKVVPTDESTSCILSKDELTSKELIPIEAQQTEARVNEIPGTTVRNNVKLTRNENIEHDTKSYDIVQRNKDTSVDPQPSIASPPSTANTSTTNASFTLKEKLRSVSMVPLPESDYERFQEIRRMNKDRDETKHLRKSKSKTPIEKYISNISESLPIIPAKSEVLHTDSSSSTNRERTKSSSQGVFGSSEHLHQTEVGTNEIPKSTVRNDVKLTRNENIERETTSYDIIQRNGESSMDSQLSESTVFQPEMSNTSTINAPFTSKQEKLRSCSMVPLPKSDHERFQEIRRMNKDFNETKHLPKSKSKTLIENYISNTSESDLKSPAKMEVLLTESSSSTSKEKTKSSSQGVSYSSEHLHQTEAGTNEIPGSTVKNYVKLARNESIEHDTTFPDNIQRNEDASVDRQPSESTASQPVSTNASTTNASLTSEQEKLQSVNLGPLLKTDYERFQEIRRMNKDCKETKHLHKSKSKTSSEKYISNTSKSLPTIPAKSEVLRTESSSSTSRKKTKFSSQGVSDSSEHLHQTEVGANEIPRSTVRNDVKITRNENIKRETTSYGNVQINEDTSIDSQVSESTVFQSAPTNTSTTNASITSKQEKLRSVSLVPLPKTDYERFQEIRRLNKDRDETNHLRKSKSKTSLTTNISSTSENHPSNPADSQSLHTESSSSSRKNTKSSSQEVFDDSEHLQRSWWRNFMSKRNPFSRK